MFVDYGEERTLLPTVAEDHAELIDTVTPLCEEAIDGITYQDPDDLRWEQLAEMGNESIVPAGFMRLQGSFSGTATTHTHQIDLALGLDVEMPSEVAADAMKQLTAGSSDGGPIRCRLADSQEDRIVQKKTLGPLVVPHRFFQSGVTASRERACVANRPQGSQAGRANGPCRTLGGVRP